ncbi:rRNA biogenesis protein RRP5, putative [Plasmodium relictum]|uniref:rRNA biogenesis protein RRP5, putative n=1 Tax=Plasmodium relictum TaxID=85471 RepID=A0A1J1HDV0_PLARL|nr:rRNA biogenesis protein RRP5, putative [Plasmodium relictum]CRH04091.1 rRNA biogenesis protein RRP5, putative [Plasmodium relictum]
MDIKKKKLGLYKNKINKYNDIKLNDISLVKLQKKKEIKCGLEKNNSKYKITEGKKKKEKKVKLEKKKNNTKDKEISKKKKKIEKGNIVTKRTKKDCNSGSRVKDYNNKEKNVIKIKNYNNSNKNKEINANVERKKKYDINNNEKKNVIKKKIHSSNEVDEEKEIANNEINKNKEMNSENYKFIKKKKIEGMSITKDLNKENYLSLYAEIKKERDSDKVKKLKEYPNDINEKSLKKLKNNEETYEKWNEPFENNIYNKEKKKKKINNNSSNNINIDNNNIVTPFDYEKLLMSKKNNSAIWISYIAYYLQKNNLNEARKVAERALKTIDIQEVEEKLNIYLCYLNMECSYGDKLYDVFKRALLCNNEKFIYLHMINILKKNNKLIQLKEICEEAIKKFKYSKKIWSCYLEILHNTFKDEEYAHAILLKSLHSLEKRKHLNMIINAARFEYKYSNKERGKTYFEKLIHEYPKRSDIWFTYLDIHINSLTKNEKKEKIKLNINDIEFIRNIFERFISIKFKPRIMKMIFTKWLLFEKNHGNLHNQKVVQQKAYDYVESLNAIS